ncbi:hypothetical protein C8R45DRAFT_1010438 [Mycena sanguinolenta]|nr:hypothetical protein C8R45DRAFT_1010438 [Mycena sanguinolenta]
MEDWTTFAIAEPGYESDTGPRDIPTLSNFETTTPVTVVHGHPQRGGNRKVLNRRGRAICRVMAARGWSYKTIAYIFRISESSVSRAVENQFYKPPRDRIEEDLERAGTEFRGELPPPPPEAQLRELLPTPVLRKALVLIHDSSDESDLELQYPDSGSSSSGRQQRTAKKRCHTRLQEVAADENEDEPDAAVAGPRQTYAPYVRPQFPQSQVASTSNLAVSSKLNRGSSLRSQPASRPHFSPLPLPQRRTGTQSQAHTSQTNSTLSLSLSDFLLQALPSVSTDLASHLELLMVHGFTPPHLCALATWNPHEVHEALNDLLMERPRALGYASMTALIFVKFEIAIRKLVGIAPTPRKPSLPRLDTGTPALPLFLANVMGFDLSPHATLVSTQGYDVAALRAMLSWPPAELRATLRKTLLDPAMTEDEETTLVPLGMKGMSPLELWAVELCVRRAAEEQIEKGR